MSTVIRPHERLEQRDAAVLKEPSAIANRWGVSTSMVTKLLRQGKLPGVRIGKLWRIRMSDVEAFESNQACKSEGDAYVGI